LKEICQHFRKVAFCTNKGYNTEFQGKRRSKFKLTSSWFLGHHSIFSSSLYRIVTTYHQLIKVVLRTSQKHYFDLLEIGIFFRKEELNCIASRPYKEKSCHCSLSKRIVYRVRQKSCRSVHSKYSFSVSNSRFFCVVVFGFKSLY